MSFLNILFLLQSASGVYESDSRLNVENEIFRSGLYPHEEVAVFDAFGVGRSHWLGDTRKNGLIYFLHERDSMPVSLTFTHDRNMNKNQFTSVQVGFANGVTRGIGKGVYDEKAVKHTLKLDPKEPIEEIAVSTSASFKYPTYLSVTMAGHWHHGKFSVGKKAFTERSIKRQLAFERDYGRLVGLIVKMAGYKGQGDLLAIAFIYTRDDSYGGGIDMGRKLEDEVERETQQRYLEESKDPKLCFWCQNKGTIRKPMLRKCVLCHAKVCSSCCKNSISKDSARHVVCDDCYENIFERDFTKIRDLLPDAPKEETLEEKAQTVGGGCGLGACLQGLKGLKDLFIYRNRPRRCRRMSEVKRRAIYEAVIEYAHLQKDYQLLLHKVRELPTLLRQKADERDGFEWKDNWGKLAFVSVAASATLVGLGIGLAPVVCASAAAVAGLGTIILVTKGLKISTSLAGTCITKLRKMKDRRMHSLMTSGLVLIAVQKRMTEVSGKIMKISGKKAAEVSYFRTVVNTLDNIASVSWGADLMEFSWDLAEYQGIYEGYMAMTKEELLEVIHSPPTGASASHMTALYNAAHDHSDIDPANIKGEVMANFVPDADGVEEKLASVIVESADDAEGTETSMAVASDFKNNFSWFKKILGNNPLVNDVKNFIASHDTFLNSLRGYHQSILNGQTLSVISFIANVIDIAYLIRDIGRGSKAEIAADMRKVATIIEAILLAGKVLPSGGGTMSFDVEDLPGFDEKEL